MPESVRAHRTTPNSRCRPLPRPKKPTNLPLVTFSPDALGPAVAAHQHDRCLNHSTLSRHNVLASGNLPTSQSLPRVNGVSVGVEAVCDRSQRSASDPPRADYPRRRLLGSAAAMPGTWPYLSLAGAIPSLVRSASQARTHSASATSRCRSRGLRGLRFLALGGACCALPRAPDGSYHNGVL